MTTESVHPFQERVRYLYNNKKMSDFCFIVGPTQTEIPGHKFLFSIVSDVFYEKFYVNDSECLEIYIPDISYFSFMEFLKYIYINDLLLTQKIVMDILQLSVDYKMPNLLRRCIDYLEKNLYIRNALFVLQMSIKFDLFDLKDKCLEVIGLHWEKLFKDAEFLNQDEELVRLILKTNHFVCSEYQIFEAAMSWAKKMCEKHNMPPYAKNIREVLKDLWECIRFENMSDKEIKLVMDGKGALSQPTFQRIANIVQKKKNSRNIRKDLAKRIIMYNRFQTIKTEFFINDVRNFADLYFSVSEPMYCYGFGIYGPTKSGLNWIPKQKVTAALQNSNCSQIKIKSIEFQYDGSNRIYELAFERPQLLNTSGFYYVTITYDEPDNVRYECHVGKDGVEEEEIDGITVTYKHTKDNFGSSASSSRLTGIMLRKFNE